MTTKTEMTQETELLPSPVNTTISLDEQIRQLHERTEKRKALIAAAQTVVKPKWIDALEARLGSFEYVPCPQCGIEWSKLKENGICWDCDAKKADGFFKSKTAEAELLKIFGSMKAMNHYTFQNFRVNAENREAFEKMQKFDSSKDNVYIFGTCGSGKTHLSRAAAKVYALNGREVIVTSPLRMVDYFRTKSEVEKEDRFDEYARANILLIDDLGISKHTDFALEVLCEVLNRRALQMRNGLIVTSNLSL